MKKQTSLLAVFFLITTFLVAQSSNPNPLKDRFNHFQNLDIENFEQSTQDKGVDFIQNLLSDPFEINDIVWVIDSSYTNFWNVELSDWSLYSKAINSYNSLGSRLETIIFLWDSEINDWILNQRYFLVYNSSGALIENTYFFWDSEINDWVETSKYTYFYDDNGNQTEYFRYEWDLGLNDWAPLWKSASTYDSADNRIELIGYQWDINLNSWKEHYRLEESYDVNGYLTEDIVSYNYSGETNDWTLIRKSVHFYNEVGNLTEGLGYDWDSFLNDWVMSSKSEFNYSANGELLLSAFSYYWDLDLTEWINSTKAEGFYDGDGNLIESYYYLWDIDLNDWVENYKNEAAYDSNGNEILLVDYFWNIELNEWIGIVRGDFFWSSMIVGIEEFALSGFKIYPNPTSNNLNLVFEDASSDFTVELYNINGQKFYNQQFEASTTFYTIDLPEIPKGMYLVKVRGEDFVKTEKLIVR